MDPAVIIKWAIAITLLGSAVVFVVTLAMLSFTAVRLSYISLKEKRKKENTQ